MFLNTLFHIIELFAFAYFILYYKVVSPFFSKFLVFFNSYNPHATWSAVISYFLRFAFTTPTTFLREHSMKMT